MKIAIILIVFAGCIGSARGGIFDDLKKGVETVVVEPTKQVVNTVVVEPTKQAVNLGVQQTKQAVNLGVQQTKQAVDLGVHQTKQAVDLGVHQTKQAVDIGLKTGVKPVVSRTDCNACKCFKPPCSIKKNLCYHTGATFRDYVAGVETACANYRGAHSAATKIEQAKRRLVRIGVFKARDFDGVQIRWCSHLGDFADGIVTSARRIWIHPRYKNEDSGLCLECTLAHEMYHIKQYEAWGAQGFHCRYSVALASGDGFREENSVERDAYAFERKVEKKLGWSSGLDI